MTAENSTCIFILSMPHASEQRAAVQKQLRAHGLPNARVWPGVVLGNQSSATLDTLANRCIVPRGYASQALAPSLLGTVGSTIAHLSLLHHAHQHAYGCSWVMVLADDVVLLRGFRPWLESLMRLPSADFINLKVVRGWGEAVGSQGARRVSGSLNWPAWTKEPSASNGAVKAPNLLVSGYLARRAQLGELISALQRTEGWAHDCSIDQVLSRAQYALTSASAYTSYVIDATTSLLGHCAVSQAEVAVYARTKPERHMACAREHPSIYGHGSRSHAEHPGAHSQRVAKGSSGRDLGAALMREPPLPVTSSAISVCQHRFRVPGDRVVFDEGSHRFRTLPRPPLSLAREQKVNLDSNIQTRCRAQSRTPLDTQMD